MIRMIRSQLVADTAADGLQQQRDLRDVAILMLQNFLTELQNAFQQSHPNKQFMLVGSNLSADYLFCGAYWSERYVTSQATQNLKTP